MASNTHTELDVAHRVADGSLPSPVPFSENMWLVNLRITGTGLAYRVGLQEIVWRDPKHYLNDEFIARCNGLPVVVNHPDENVLTEVEFRQRIVGTVMYTYIRGEEVWAVCRIYDSGIVGLIMKGDVSTSPGVVFDETSGNVELEGDEDNLLIEGKPYLIDHIALVTADHGSLGVWDKRNTPEGIEITSIEETFDMDEENQKLLARLISTAVGDALKPVQTSIKNINARMDAAGICDARDDSHERDDARNDESEETRRRHESEGEKAYHARQRENARGDESEETRRRHEREGEERYERYERNDDSMSEEEIRAAISRLEKKLRREDRDSEHEREGMERYEESRDDLQANDPVHFEKEPKVKEQLNRANANEHGRDEGARDDSRGREHEREGMERYERSRDDAANFNGHHIDVRDDERMSDARARADSAFTAIGKSAPVPFNGESSFSYRLRALAVMQKHSKAHHDVNIRAIKDSAALKLVEDAIYTSAQREVENAIQNTRGQLVPRVRNDEAGRRITEFRGDMNVWLDAFKLPGRVMSKINSQMRAQ